MAKFKKGNRVECIIGDVFLEVGDAGTVMEDDSEVPYVLWDGKIWDANDGQYAVPEDDIKLIG